MYAIEFVTKVCDGKIEVPYKFLDKFNSEVKVILLKSDNDNTTLINEPKVAKGFGMLSHKADPSLWEQERGALERHVVENYDYN